VRVVAEHQHAGPDPAELGERVVLDPGACDHLHPEAPREGVAHGDERLDAGAVGAAVRRRGLGVVVHQQHRRRDAGGAERRQWGIERGRRPVVGDDEIDGALDLSARRGAEPPLDPGHAAAGSGKQ
jgi:hypothetical protein